MGQEPTTVLILVVIYHLFGSIKSKKYITCDVNLLQSNHSLVIKTSDEIRCPYAFI